MALEQPIADLTTAVNGVTAAVEADTARRQQSRDEALAFAQSSAASAALAAADRVAIQTALGTAGGFVYAASLAELTANTTALYGQVDTGSDAGIYARQTRGNAATPWVRISTATVQSLDVRLSETASLVAYRASLGRFVGEGDPFAIPEQVSESGSVLRERQAETGVIFEATQPRTLDGYRAGLGQFLGEGDPETIPVRVSESGYIIQGVSRQGTVVQATEGGLDAYRAGLGQFLGDGDPATVPQYVSEAGFIISGLARDGALIAAGTGGVSQPEAAPYIIGGALRAVGGSGGDRVLNGPAGRTWLSAQAVGGSILGVAEQEGARFARRLSPRSGEVFSDLALRLILAYGQSNGEGQGNELASLVFTANPYPKTVLMPATSADNSWLGQVTGGGDTIQLLPEQVTGLVPWRPAFGDATHGTLAVEALAVAMSARAASGCGGFTPLICIATLAEGGQAIASLKKGSSKFGYANILTLVQRVVTFAAAMNIRVVFDLVPMDQGEANNGSTTLGADHAAILTSLTADIPAITGQAEPVRMISSQMSSFLDSHDGLGARSILDYAIANAAVRRFCCLGPCYADPYASDFVHHTSVGHARRGYRQDAADRVIQAGGWWLPLHMSAASVTSSREITVSLSEPAAITSGLVAAISGEGIVVPGRTVTAVAVPSGEPTKIKITTAEDAAGATTVRAALAGHASDTTRAAETVPRSTIFSTASYGSYPDGSGIRKALCHQQIAIS